MKKLILIVAVLMLTGCAYGSRYNTQRGALVGAGLGALSGQAIGHNTEGTLIGTGAGALLGAIVGNAMDQQYQEEREGRETYRSRDWDRNSWASQGNEPEPPPGRWMVVPGHWEGNRWVPAHKEWRPVQPM